MVRSRKRRGLAEIQRRIAEFKSSGLTKTEFATRLGVHPHLYALVTERRLDTAGVWHPAPQIPSRILEQLFSARFLSEQTRLGFISPELIARMQTWKQTVCNVD